MENNQENFLAHEDSAKEVSKAEANFAAAKDLAQEAEPHEMADAQALAQEAVNALEAARQKYDQIIEQGQQIARDQLPQLRHEAEVDYLQFLLERKAQVDQEIKRLYEIIGDDTTLETEQVQFSESFEATLKELAGQYHKGEDEVSDLASRMRVLYQPKVQESRLDDVVLDQTRLRLELEARGPFSPLNFSKDFKRI